MKKEALLIMFVLMASFAAAKVSSAYKDYPQMSFPHLSAPPAEQYPIQEKHVMVHKQRTRTLFRSFGYDANTGLSLAKSDVAVETEKPMYMGLRGIYGTNFTVEQSSISKKSPEKLGGIYDESKGISNTGACNAFKCPLFTTVIGNKDTKIAYRCNCAEAAELIGNPEKTQCFNSPAIVKKLGYSMTDVKEAENGYVCKLSKVQA